MVDVETESMLVFFAFVKIGLLQQIVDMRPMLCNELLSEPRCWNFENIVKRSTAPAKIPEKWIAV